MEALLWSSMIAMCDGLLRAILTENVNENNLATRHFAAEGVLANRSAGRFKLLAVLRTCRAKLLFVKCSGMTVVPAFGAIHDCNTLNK